MSEFGKRTSKDTVRLERLLPGPVERVWAYLVESEKRGKWLAKGELEPWVGGKVQLQFLHSSLTPVQEPIPERFKMMECGVNGEETVTVFEPPKKLAITWGNGTSEVSFELTPRGEQVLLVITHTRLGEQEMILVASGWHTHAGILEANLEQRTPGVFWSVFLEIEAEYTRLFGIEEGESK